MRVLKIFTPVFAIALILGSCKKEALINGGSGLEDWTPETHGYGATPNYDVVFNQTEVQRLDFVIEPEYWAAMQSDLESLMATMTGGPGQGGFTDESPMYIPVQMFHNGKQWYDVGLRYKGNSSLKNAYSQGINKLPFRIETNHFENENPNINGQTFHGFTQLSLSSNFKDVSFMHEKVAADVFREFGVPAAQTAFYRVYVDYGDGPIYFGLYTLVEVVFDTPMLNKQFGSSTGNCYKPDSEGAYLNDPSNINSTFFPNKTNEGASYDDIEQLINNLIADTRISNPAQWRSDLESVIDMDLYLKYLAANTTMKNWDTYGRMTHNFYLYNNPSSSKLTWIPWDNNEAFSDGPGGGGPGPGSSMSPLDFDFSNLSSTPTSSTGDVAWPMIEYIYDDPVYKAQYDSYIDEFITTVFTVSNVSDKFTTFHNMVQPYVTGTDGEISGYTILTNSTEFDNSLSDLINYVSTRVVEADNYTP
jgi:spore coat protein CotH